MIADFKEMNSEEKEALSLLDRHILRERHKKNRRHLYTEIIITVAVVYVMFGVIVGIAIVQGDSMLPNLTDKSVALFYRLVGTYKRNDIVIFKDPDDEMILIKRVVAVAGDTVDIDDETGECLINGVAQEESMIGNTYSSEGGVSFPITIPQGSVFVLGDNREVALDSRHFGPIKIKSLIGKVVFEIKILRD